MAHCVPLPLPSSAAAAFRASAQVLAAFAPWVRLSQGVHDGILNSDAQIEPAVLAQHPLTSAALEGLNRDETFDAAVDAVSELVRCTTMGDPDAPEADPRAAPLAAVLVPRIMQLRPRFAADARSEDGSDGDVAKGLARLFAEVGESYVALIATGAPDVRARPHLPLRPIHVPTLGEAEVIPLSE